MKADTTPILRLAGFPAICLPLETLNKSVAFRIPLAVLAGILLALSFPDPGVAGLAWVAPGFILLAAGGTRGRLTFRLGYVSGLSHYLVSLRWLLLIPVRGYPILGWFALSAFMAIYPAFWTWLCWKIYPAKLFSETEPNRPTDIAARFLSVPWAKRGMWCLSGAALWVALEMFIARFLGGFPWNLLGCSQYRLTPLLQIAATTGIYGVSFLLVWTSLSLLCSAMLLLRQPNKRTALGGEILLPMLVVAGIFAMGWHKLLQEEKPSREYVVALIQPSIPQTMIWDETASAKRFQELLRLTEEALSSTGTNATPQILIWPEAALPKMLRYDGPSHEAVASIATRHKVWMIVGSDDADPAANSKDPRDDLYYNSSFLVSPDGELVQRYIKRNLVIFGEYIPLVDWFPIIKRLTPIEGSFTPGKKDVPFFMPDLQLKASVLICYEDGFPHLARRSVADDTDFLVNITNDGWFGEGSAQMQQAAGAVYRAIENAVPVIRCANNGFTCWIDQFGRIRESFEAKEHGIYGAGYLVAHIPASCFGSAQKPTYYRRHGDVFGIACGAWVVLQVLRLRFAAAR